MFPYGVRVIWPIFNPMVQGCFLMVFELFDTFLVPRCKKGSINDILKTLAHF